MKFNYSSAKFVTNFNTYYSLQIVIINSVPWPTSLFTVILPLCFSIIFAEIANPNPVPTPTPFVVYPAVKILFISDFFIPFPVSFIDTVKVFGVYEVEIVIFPLPSIAWHALTKTLVNT